MRAVVDGREIRSKAAMLDALATALDFPDYFGHNYDALNDLEAHDQQAAQLVKLRYFAGLTHQQAAKALGISRRAADGVWALAKAWLYRQIAQQ